MRCLRLASLPSTRYNSFMKKQILFDNDGVLVETEKWYFTANVEILASMGIELSEERYRDIMIQGQSAFLLAEEAGYDNETVERARDRRNDLYQHYLQTEDIAIEGADIVGQHVHDVVGGEVFAGARRGGQRADHHDEGVLGRGLPEGHCRRVNRTRRRSDCTPAMTFR